MEKESTGKRGMGVGYKGSQGQTKRTVELQEDEEMYGQRYNQFCARIFASTCNSWYHVQITLWPSWHLSVQRTTCAFMRPRHFVMWDKNTCSCRKPHWGKNINEAELFLKMKRIIQEISYNTKNYGNQIFITVKGKGPTRCDKVCSFVASTGFGHQYAHHKEYN
jgi:hypothetical protein